MAMAFNFHDGLLSDRSLANVRALAAKRFAEDAPVLAWSQPNGAARFGVTERHFRRVRRRFEAAGDEVVVHGLRGRRSNRSLPSETREQVLAMAKDPDYAPSTPIARCLRTPTLKPLRRDGHAGRGPRLHRALREPLLAGHGPRDAEAAGVAPGSPVVVERRLSGELRFRHRGCYLTPKALGAVRSATPKPAPAPATAKPRPKPPKPGRNHPWRKHFSASVAQAVAKREHRAAHSNGTGPEQCRASS